MVSKSTDKDLQAVLKSNGNQIDLLVQFYGNFIDLDK